MIAKAVGAGKFLAVPQGEDERCALVGAQHYWVLLQLADLHNSSYAPRRVSTARKKGVDEI